MSNYKISNLSKGSPKRESFLYRIFPYLYVLFFIILLMAANWAIEAIFESPEEESLALPPQDAIASYRPVSLEVTPSRGGRVIQMEATAYTLAECDGDGVTATGTIPQEGRTVAVDPNVIPYGTELIINGQRGYIAEDCGGLIKDKRLDIFMTNTKDAINYGRQTVEVQILE